MFSTVKSKVIVSIASLSIIGLIAMSYYLSATLHEMSNTNAKKSLAMISESIFQTMTTSMMMGDPDVVEKSFEDAKKIDGIEKLHIAKSKAVLEVYAPDESFTTDSLIVNVLKTVPKRL